MKRSFLVLIVLLLLTFGWQGCSSPELNARFKQAYSMMNTAPDSVLFLLGQIDRQTLSEKESAQYALLFTMAQDKSGQDVDSDSLIGQAYSYYKDRKQDSLYAKCLYYMGNFYLLNDSNLLAEECFTQAVQASRKTGDHYTTYLALNRLGSSLQSSNPVLAVDYAKQAYKVYTTHFNDKPSNQVYLLLEIGNSYSLALMIDSARSYFDQALACAQKLESPKLQSSVYQSLALLVEKQEKTDSALIFSKKAWELAPDHSQSLAFNLAYAYIKADSVAQSEALLAQLCSVKSDITRHSAYQLLTECAFRKGNLSQAWEYTDSTLTIYRGMHESTLKDRAAYYQANSRKLLALEVLKQEKGNREFLFIGTFLLLVILALSLILYYRNRVLLYRNRMLKIEKEKEIETLLHRSQEEKNEFRLQQSERQIKLLKSYVCSVVDMQEKVNEAFEKDKSNFFINEKFWSDLEQFLDVSEGGFVSRLKEEFPALTQEDLKFCMLQRLGISIKKQSQIYGIAEVSVKQKQSKFKHKLGIEDLSISLRKFLQTY